MQPFGALSSLIADSNSGLEETLFNNYNNLVGRIADQFV